jgi:RimJ/RimL family protein N-acetyltransferase
VEIRAGQLELHLLTADEAERVIRRQRLPAEKWASDYPSFEQIDFLEAYLVEAQSAQPRYYWQAQLRRRIDGLVVGGAGVTGPPDADGAVVIGYELAGGLSDQLHGVDILKALIQVARDMEATRVTATVFDSDAVRRQVYLDAGLNEVRHEGRVVHLGRYV